MAKKLDYNLKSMAAQNQHVKKFYKLSADLFGAYEEYRKMCGLVDQAATKFAEERRAATEDGNLLTQLGAAIDAAEAEIAFRPKMQSALFVAIYALTEDTMNRVCDLLHEVSLEGAQAGGKEPIAPNDLKGSGLPRARCYLEKVHSVRFGDDFAAVADYLRELRNAFAHTSGDTTVNNYDKIKKAEDRLRRYLRGRTLTEPVVKMAYKLHAIELTPGTFSLSIKHDFNESMIEVLARESAGLLSAIDEHILALTGCPPVNESQLGVELNKFIIDTLTQSVSNEEHGDRTVE